MPMLTDPIALARYFAPLNPYIAYGILTTPKIPASYKLDVLFTDQAAGQIKADFLSSGNKSRLGCDFIVCRRRFTVRRPNAFVGSVFKAESDAANIVASGMDVRLVLDACPRFLITDDYQAIENTAAPATTDWECCCDPFVIPWGGTVTAEFRNSRPLALDEIPTEVQMVFDGYILNQCRNFSGCHAKGFPAVAEFLKQKIDVDVSYMAEREEAFVRGLSGLDDSGK